MKLYTAIIFFLLFLNFSYSQSPTKLSIAQTEFANKNYDKAIELYTQIIESPASEDKCDAFHRRAYCYYKQKKNANAKSDVKKSLKVKKRNKNYSKIKGSSYWLYSLIISREGTTPKSLKLLKKSSQYIQSSLLYSTIGFDEIYLGKYQDAIKSLNTSIQLNKNNAWAYSNRALAYLKLNEIELARIDVTKSIKLDNQNPFAYKHSALIYIAIGDNESACIELDKAAKLQTSFRMADHKLEEIALLKKEYCEN